MFPSSKSARRKKENSITKMFYSISLKEKEIACFLKGVLKLFFSNKSFDYENKDLTNCHLVLAYPVFSFLL